jgi:hypothetical protein
MVIVSFIRCSLRLSFVLFPPIELTGGDGDKKEGGVGDEEDPEVKSMIYHSYRCLRFSSHIRTMITLLYYVCLFFSPSSCSLLVKNQINNELFLSTTEMRTRLICSLVTIDTSIDVVNTSSV